MAGEGGVALLPSQDMRRDDRFSDGDLSQRRKGAEENVGMKTRMGLSLWLGVSAVCLGVGGCSSSVNPELAGPEYPAAKSQTSTLDIQVVRGETSITVTNTTARAYGKSRLWLNRWYSREIESLGVGESVELKLNSFRDQHGEAFRSGGFFATRKPQVVQQVQLETADGLLGLVAVGKETE